MEDFVSWLVGSASSVSDPAFLARCVLLVACVQLFDALAALIGKGTR